MSRYSTIALSHTHANRARHIARHLGIPVSALLATLIDGAFENEFDIRPSTVTQDGANLSIEFGENYLTIPADKAASFANSLRSVAASTPSFSALLDLDLPQMPTFSRKGSAVVIQTSAKPIFRHTMGVVEANRIAAELDTFAQ